MPSPEALVIALSVIFFTRELLDHDLHWHLATGRYLAGTGFFPFVDPFTHTSAGDPWIAFEWLGELFFFAVSGAGGPGALLAVRGLFAFACLGTLRGLFLDRGVTSARARLVALVLAGATIQFQLRTTRPLLFSTLFVCVFVRILHRHHLGRTAPLGLLPILALFWVNLHGAFILAPIIVGTFLVSLVVEGRRDPGTPSPAPLARSLGLVLLACCVNPRGPAHLLYPFRYLGSTPFHHHLTEWAPFRPGEHPALVILLLLIALGFALGRRRPLTADGLLAAGALLLMVQGIRNTFLLATFVTPALAVQLQAICDRFPSPRDRSLAAGSAMGAAAFACAIWFTILLTGPPRYRPGHFPVEATRYLREHPRPGRIFNQYEYGGWLAFHLGRPHALDGRADLYMDNGLFAEYLAFLDRSPGWLDTLDRRGCDHVLFERDHPVPRDLEALGWVRVHEDAFFAVVARRAGTGAF